MLELNKIYNMNCLEGLKLLDNNSVDSIVTDPPYGIEFMGKEWDSFSDDTNTALGKQSPANKKEDTPFKKRGKPIDGWCEKDRLFARNNYYEFTYQWAKECFRVLKPGGFILVFGSPRMYHRMTCAIEDAGFSIRDCIMWLYGSGMPKSHDISKAIDKKAGVEREIIGTYQHPDGKPRNINNHKANKDARIADQDWGMKQSGFQPITAPTTPEAKQWDGWGTCLKPAHEPIVVARKPLSEKTIADNVLKWGTGGINIDDCRVEYQSEEDFNMVKAKCNFTENSKSIGFGTDKTLYGNGITPLDQARNCVKEQGRFPANVILDEEAGKLLDEQSGISKSTGGRGEKSHGTLGNSVYGKYDNKELAAHAGGLGDSGGASRFFYCAKASKKERGEGNNHPTVKPISLIKYLITLVTPPQGICLDPFEGSGTHAKACKELGFNYIGFEREIMYCNIAESRI